MTTLPRTPPCSRARWAAAMSASGNTRSSGALRRDFDPADLPLVFLANSALRAGAPEVAPGASRRLIA